MSLCEALARHFSAHPGEWIDGRELARIAGAYAWRSRVSDCRRKLGMHIENRQRSEYSWDALACSWRDQPYVVSEYRYLPAEDSQCTTNESSK